MPAHTHTHTLTLTHTYTHARIHADRVPQRDTNLFQVCHVANVNVDGDEWFFSFHNAATLANFLVGELATKRGFKVLGLAHRVEVLVNLVHEVLEEFDGVLLLPDVDLT